MESKIDCSRNRDMRRPITEKWKVAGEVRKKEV